MHIILALSFTVLSVISSPIKVSLDSNELVILESSDEQCGSRMFSERDIARDYREISTAISYAKNVLNEVTIQWVCNLLLFYSETKSSLRLQY